jgi:hypothetical protein
MIDAEHILSALQHIKHMYPGSPLRIIKVSIFARLDISVTQEAMKARSAVLRRALLGFVRKEYKFHNGTRNRIVR